MTAKTMMRAAAVGAVSLFVALTVSGSASAAAPGDHLERRVNIGPDNCMMMNIYQGDQQYTRDIKVTYLCQEHRSISVTVPWQFDPWCQDAPGPRSLMFEEVTYRHGNAYYC